MVLHRFQPLHQMATSSAHDIPLQEAHTLSFVHPILIVFSLCFFRNLGQYELPFNQTMVTVRVQPLHAMASYIPHDSFLQEAIPFLPSFSILKNCIHHGRDVIRASHTSRLYPGLYAVIKTMPRMWIQLLCVSVLYSMGSRGLKP